MSINPKPMHTASTQNNLHSINPITMHTASDFLSVGFPSPKTYTLPSTPHHSVILREAEGEVVESIIEKKLSPSGRGGRRRRWVMAVEE